MKKKILVVDDEQDLTMLIDYIFSSTGLYDVVVANDGRQAQEMALKERPDLVLLDYIMPEVRGDEVLKFFRERETLKDVPVIIMSGLGGNVYFENLQEKQEAIFSDLKEGLERMSQDGSSVAFPYELMKKYNVKRTLSKPFSAKQLKDLAAEIFETIGQ